MTELDQAAGRADAPDWGAPRSKTVQWHDPLIAAAAAVGSGLSGLEFLRAIRDGRVPPAPIAVLTGFRPVEVEEGRVVFEGAPDESVYNPIGMVHGGLRLHAGRHGGGLRGALHPPGRRRLHLDRPQRQLHRRITSESGTLRAIGTAVKPGRRVAFSRAEILDAAGKVVASAASSCLIIPSAEAGGA